MGRRVKESRIKTNYIEDFVKAKVVKYIKPKVAIQFGFIAMQCVKSKALEEPELESMRNKCIYHCDKTLKSESLYCYAVRISKNNTFEGDQVVELLFFFLKIELKCDTILTLL